MSGETLTLTVAPDWGLPISTEPRVHRVDFGDDYVQRAPWGININPKQLNLVFSKRTTAVASSLESTFERATGGILYYTLPYETVARSYDILRYDRKLEDYNAETVTVSLKETADSDAFDVSPLNDEFTADSDRWTNLRKDTETMTIGPSVMLIQSNSRGSTPVPAGKMTPIPLQGSWKIESLARHVCTVGATSFSASNYRFPDYAVMGVLNSFTGKMASLGLGRCPTGSYGVQDNYRMFAEKWTSSARTYGSSGEAYEGLPWLLGTWTGSWKTMRIDVTSEYSRLWTGASYLDVLHEDIGGRPTHVLLANEAANSLNGGAGAYGYSEFDYIHIGSI